MNQTTYRTTNRCALLVLFMLLSPWLGVAAERPNIVLILADDVGVEPIGCYGGESYETPHIDRLAAGGLKFNHCYSMPTCHPTRTTLLTGRYPFRLDHPGWGDFPKDAEDGTLAHALKRAGYATAVAGKWQLALLGKKLDHPHRLGFDEYCLFGWHEGARFHDPFIWQNGERREGTEGQYGPKLYVDFLLDFMNEQKEADKPFFAFYSMALCHNVTDDLKEPVPYGPDGRYMNYAEMAASMDEMVGRLVNGMQRLGVREDTLILFTGDNGTAKSYIERYEDGKYVHVPFKVKWNGREVRGGKGTLTDAGTHVPLIAHWPGVIEAGRTTDALVDMSDFYATFADLAGVEKQTDPPIDGISFAPVLRGKSDGEREWAFAEHRGKYWVRTQDWKLHGGNKLVPMPDHPGLPNRLPTDSPQAAHKKLQAAIQQLGLGKTTR